MEFIVCLHFSFKRLHFLMGLFSCSLLFSETTLGKTLTCFTMFSLQVTSLYIL